jgi:hypothetical protein
LAIGGAVFLVAMVAAFAWVVLLRDPRSQAARIDPTNTTASTAAAATPDVWARYSSPGCGFSVLLPTAPEVTARKETIEGTSLPWYAYAAIGTDVLADASCWDMSHFDFAPTAKLSILADEPERIRKAFDGKYVWQGDATVDGNAAMGMTISWGGQDHDLCNDVRVLFVGKRCYHFLATYPCDARGAGVDQFLSSIRFTAATPLAAATAVPTTTLGLPTAGGSPKTIAPSLVPEWCAENGSCYGDISTATGQPKTVAVQSYYRHDGTYVRGHFRGAPRR